MSTDPTLRNFLSDTIRGASPEVLAAITAANEGSMAPYGNDPVSEQIQADFAEVFETDRLEVLLMAAGTGANALALGLLAAPYTQVLCYSESHINVHQCGAPEFYSGGAKLLPLAAEHARLSPQTVADSLQQLAATCGPMMMPPSVLSLTQASELGTVYRADRITELAAVARRHGLRVHVDGARFANAVVATGASPAELSWKAGVTTLAFGATKNGALAAEALLLFDPELAGEAHLRLKRGGQQWAKMRFLSAQHRALLKADLWLRNARHANQQAARLGAGLAQIPGIELAHPVETNQVFVSLSRELTERLEGDGFRFGRWSTVGDRIVIRLVCAFDTPPEAVDRLLAAAGEHRL